MWIDRYKQEPPRSPYYQIIVRDAVNRQYVPAFIDGKDWRRDGNPDAFEPESVSVSFTYWQPVFSKSVQSDVKQVGATIPA